MLPGDDDTYWPLLRQHVVCLTIRLRGQDPCVRGGFSSWAEVEASGAVCVVSMYILHAFVSVHTCICTM